MNIFAVLDISDNEEETPRVPAQKKGGAKEVAAKTDGKNQSKAPKTVDNKTKTDNGASKVIPGKAGNDKAKPAKAEGEGEAQKDNNRGGRPRGKEGSKHGEKQHTKEKQPEGQEGGEKKAARRPKREFDRRSGTGRGRELSKGGRGAFGFGNVDQDALEAEKDPNAVIESENQPAEGEEEVAPETETAPEPQPTVFTLDEYFKKREEARASSTVLGVKQETAAQAAENEAKASKDVKNQRSTGKEQLLDVGFKIQTPTYTYERREREPRGDSRGGRGAGRGGRTNTKRPAGPAVVFDSGDFPSL